MAKHNNHPRVVFCQSEHQAQSLAFSDPDGRAFISGPGTLAFHSLLAAHGAGEFTTLYVAPAVRGKFMCPAGAIIEEIV